MNDMGLSDETTMIQMHFVNEALNQIYKNNGFEYIPLDRKERKSMIKKCNDDIHNLFKRIFDTTDETQNAMNHFKLSNGLLLVFLTLLNKPQLKKILGCNWYQIHQSIPQK